MRQCLAFFLLSLTLAVGASASADDSAGVRERLSAAPVLRGSFEQSKQLQGFRNPLRSRGEFLIARERGVVWDTREPFASRTVLTRQKLLTRLPDGSSRVLLDASASPAMSAVNSLLLALVAGDLQALSQQFESSETLLADGAWRLQLTPREPGLARVIASIELSGDRHVRAIHISERAGDSTQIRFSDLREEPAALSPDEAGRFE